MTAPTTPFYVSSWGQEQADIKSRLEDFHTPPAPTKEFNDGLGNIINQVSCSSYSIRFNHDHVKRAFEYIKDYPFPTTIEHFNKIFRFHEWDIVCETMLVAVRLGELVPNAYQRNLLGIFIHEHRPVCCCKCGLTPGIWCGM